jgi:regulator of RNase E activity RraA
MHDRSTRFRRRGTASRALGALSCTLLSVAALERAADAQLFSVDRERLIALTPKNPFDRSPDGRPRIPDALLARAKVLSTDEAFVFLTGAKYPNQFDGRWQILQPGKKLIGRALTAVFMPARPDVADVLDAEAAQKGQPKQVNQRVIDIIKPGDVLVIDLFGKVEAGTFAGNNLAAVIYGTTRTGLVVDGAVRDPDKITELGMPVYVRGTHPAGIAGVMLAGVNVPVRIGHTTVMPGDLVFADRGGVTFIPPHLVEEVVAKAEESDATDNWRKSKLLSGRYKSTDLYPAITHPDLKKEYEEFQKNLKARKTTRSGAPSPAKDAAPSAAGAAAPK